MSVDRDRTISNDTDYGQATASAPVVAGAGPPSGSAAGGDSVTVTGSGFTGATAVDFGTAAAAIQPGEDGAVRNDLLISHVPGRANLVTKIIGVRRAPTHGV